MHQVFILEESTRKKYWSDKKMTNSNSHLQLVQQNCQEETTNSAHTLKGGNRPWGAKISVENFKANRECLNRQNQKMTLKPGKTSGRFKVTSSIVITMRVQLYVPKEETFPIPLKYIDVTRSTSSDLDAIRTEACQIRGKVSQSSLYWKKNLPRDICGPGGDWHKFKRLPDLRKCGLKYGPKWAKKFFGNYEIYTDIHLLVSCGKDSSRKFQGNWDGQKYRIGKVCLFIENTD